MAAWLFGAPAAAGLYLLVAALVVFKHRENIHRLLRGEENRLSFGGKPAGHRDRIGVVHRLAVVVTLRESDTPASPQVDRRPNLHRNRFLSDFFTEPNEVLTQRGLAPPSGRSQSS